MWNRKGPGILLHLVRFTVIQISENLTCTGLFILLGNNIEIRRKFLLYGAIVLLIEARKIVEHTKHIMIQIARCRHINMGIM